MAPVRKLPLVELISSYIYLQMPSSFTWRENTLRAKVQRNERISTHYVLLYYVLQYNIISRSQHDSTGINLPILRVAYPRWILLLRTQSYEYYLFFSARHAPRYVISRLTDIFKPQPSYVCLQAAEQLPRVPSNVGYHKIFKYKTFLTLPSSTLIIKAPKEGPLGHDARSSSSPFLWISHCALLDF